MPDDTEANKMLVNRPKNTRFHQQRLKAWRPVITAKGAFPILIVIGILFIPTGVVLLVSCGQVIEKVFEYTHCERFNASSGKFLQTRCSEEVRQSTFYTTYSRCPCKVSFTLERSMEGQVYFFYGLSNFFQNHLRYIMSKDDFQLNGGTGSPSADCEPYRYDSQKRPYAPCGAVAMSLFNDTFELNFHGTADAVHDPPVVVPLSKQNIAWKSDVERKFGKPPASSWAGTAKPHSWPKTALERSPDAYSGDYDLLVWMRPAALPTFRKLNGIVERKDLFVTGLPAGEYSVNIGYAYPVTQFGGTKRFILSTANWLGGRNPALGIAYVVVGGISLALGIMFVILHYRLPRRFNLSR